MGALGLWRLSKIYLVGWAEICPKCGAVVEAYADLCQCGFDVTGWREQQRKDQEREAAALAEAKRLEEKVQAEETERLAKEGTKGFRKIGTSFFRQKRIRDHRIERAAVGLRVVVRLFILGSKLRQRMICQHEINAQCIFLFFFGDAGWSVMANEPIEIDAGPMPLTDGDQKCIGYFAAANSGYGDARLSGHHHLSGMVGGDRSYKTRRAQPC